MKTLTGRAKLRGTIRLSSQQAFSINGIGFRKIEIVPCDKFDVQDNADFIYIYQDNVPVLKLEPRKALYVASRLENDIYITTLQTF